MKNTNKFYTVLKNLFTKKQQIENTNLETEKKLEEIVDEAYEIGTSSEEFKKTILETKIGDVIWAKRYFSEEEKDNILEGHREGPFLVIGYNEDGFICSQGTSIDLDEVKLNTYYTPTNENFLFEKETHFRLYDFKNIDSFSYIRKMGKLTDKNMEDFYKRLKLRIKENKYIKYIIEKLDLPVQLGDIIYYNNNKYIVLEIKNSKIKCLNFNIYNNGFDITDLKKIDYSNIIEFNNNIKYKFLDTIMDSVFYHIIRKVKECSDNIINQKIAQRGSIVKKDGKYYYIYGIDGQSF